MKNNQICLIGYTGFVGSFLRTKLPYYTHLYNSSNIDKIHGKSYDIAFFAGLPATKWLVNKEPQKDVCNMLSIQQHLLKANIDKFVLISTIDIYDHQCLGQTEDPQHISTESYGKHRYIMEEWVKMIYRDHHIVRLPALFGLGLKKNIIYDILNNNNTSSINPYSYFQWYDIENLYFDIKQVIHSQIKVINLFSEPISTKDLFSECFTDKLSCIEHNTLGVPQIYNQYTGYSRYNSYYWQDKETIISNLKDYIATYNKTKLAEPRLMISNLAWNQAFEDKALNILKRYNIRKVELALSKYVHWDNASMDILLDIKKKYAAHNMEIYSLQAIFYEKPYNVFEDTRAFIAHFKKVLIIARTLGASVIVFGSPKNRFIPEGLSEDDARVIFLEAMREVSKYAELNHVCVCIEPNAKDYGCNFINKLDEAKQIVKDIGSPYVKVNVDTGNLVMEDDILDIDSEYIGHVQVSEAHLAPLFSASENKISDDTHKLFSDRLCAHNISLEMKEVGEDTFEENIKKFVRLYSR